MMRIELRMMRIINANDANTARINANNIKNN